MEGHWAEDEMLVEIVERRKREGSSLKGEVMQKRCLKWKYMNECPKVKQREAQKK